MSYHDLVELDKANAGLKDLCCPEDLLDIDDVKKPKHVTYIWSDDDLEDPLSPTSGIGLGRGGRGKDLSLFKELKEELVEDIGNNRRRPPPAAAAAVTATPAVPLAALHPVPAVQVPIIPPPLVLVVPVDAKEWFPVTCETNTYKVETTRNTYAGFFGVTKDHKAP